MKTLLQFISLGEFSHRWLNFHNGGNQLRLSNVFSKNNKFSLCGPPCKHFRRPYVLRSSSFRSENPSSKYFSVKVDTKDERAPMPEPPEEKPVESKSDEPVIEGGKNNYFVGRGSINSSEAPNLIKELKIMAKETNRDEVKITEICNRLNQMEIEVSTKTYVSLLYYLSVLNKPDQALLQKILASLTERLDEIYKPTPLITSLSKSVGSLLIRDTSVLDAVINWYISKLDSVDLSTAGETIHSLAILNYYPLKADILLKALTKSKPVDYSSNIKFLNFVWSLVLLDRAEPDMIQLALSLSYRRKLEAILSPEARFPIYLKLNNIYGYAKIRNLPVKVDSGLYSSDTPWLFKLKMKRQKDTLARNIIDALVSLLPPRTFKTFLEYESGCILDAVCFLNEDQQPVQEVQFMKNKNGIKLAIQFLGFRDLCLPDKKTPTGIIMFHKSYLEASGYKVLFIPFNEFPVASNLKTKSEYLEDKIRTVLPNFSVVEW